MPRMLILICMVMLLSCWASPALAAGSGSSWAVWGHPLSGKVFIIDPGHGGPDGGAVSKSGLVEKDLTLAISLKLRDYLQEAGALVWMTREVDRDLASPQTRGYARRKTEDLKNRVAFVRSRQADALISIHMNSIPSARWHGAQTFYAPQRLESKEMAEVVQSSLLKELGNNHRLAKSIDHVYLLNQCQVPAILVEAGFLSNPQEASLLAQEKYQAQVAWAIYAGLMSYYTR